MYSFIVLGLVPGTNFQITFQVWLDSLLLLVAGLACVWLFRTHQVPPANAIFRYAPQSASALHARVSKSQRPQQATWLRWASATGHTAATLRVRIADYLSDCQPLALIND